MILGIRCSNTDYSFALLKGKKHAPQLQNVKTASFPKGYTRPNSLRWFFQEIEDYFAKHAGIVECIIKGKTRDTSRFIVAFLYPSMKNTGSV